MSKCPELPDWSEDGQKFLDTQIQENNGGVMMAKLRTRVAARDGSRNEPTEISVFSEDAQGNHTDLYTYNVFDGVIVRYDNPSLIQNGNRLQSYLRSAGSSQQPMTNGVVGRNEGPADGSANV